MSVLMPLSIVKAMLVTPNQWQSPNPETLWMHLWPVTPNLLDVALATSCRRYCIPVALLTMTSVVQTLLPIPVPSISALYITTIFQLVAGGVCPIRRLILDDICILLAYSGLVCVLCVGSGYHLFEEYRQLYEDAIIETEQLPIFIAMNYNLFNSRSHTIISNPHLHHLTHSKSVDRSTFFHLIHGNGNANIGVNFVGTKPSTSHTPFPLLRHFSSIIPFQLWAPLLYWCNYRELFKSKMSQEQEPSSPSTPNVSGTTW